MSPLSVWVLQAASSRDQNARKKCRPHKNDAFASNTIDVSHLTLWIERSEGQRFNPNCVFRFGGG
jgi:hypothetical protein